MAQVNNTPVPYWLSLPLVELTAWIRSSNQIQREEKAKAQAARAAAKTKRK